MRKIILLSHGTLAQGLYQAAQMICGDVGHLNYLCLSQEKDIAQFSQELDALLEKLKQVDELVILADIVGGSPFNTALTLLSQKALIDKAKIFYGINLPLVLQVVLAENGDNLEPLVDEARDSLNFFTQEAVAIEDEPL